mmetsp:Transcript_9127/g.19333  ORF Transcript_9127/g.19333 Transcript_9127/m.19333 type:complete len:215 (+) Transcript_9127:150-794(+)|eukprot:CAMPEP_0185855674 /NCGR_PEP_ID=MMETSP1354-20130828/26474_1 /TAXON_ID=708628 /ORGANISM="Erythrolobus madagascarensis, Strain CCMP3276" /LENGTH=214 /DNA_ID=CAMNT_0028557745 /DNA_START=54 /DNA_END=698 /DNA_ORIENTATION=+
MERERAALDALRALETKFSCFESDFSRSSSSALSVNYHSFCQPRGAQLKQPLLDARRALVPLVDRFWLRVLATHPDTFRLVMQDDVEPLAYLDHVDVAYVQPRNGAAKGEVNHSPSILDEGLRARSLEVRFEFAENEWFEDRVLYKRVVDFDGVCSVETSGVTWRNNNVKLTGPGETSFFQWFEEGGDDRGLAQCIAERVFPSALKYFLMSVEG